MKHRVLELYSGVGGMHFALNGINKQYILLSFYFFAKLTRGSLPELLPGTIMNEIINLCTEELRKNIV